MTNFELMMLQIAQEVQKDKEIGLWFFICNAGNLSCNRCPAKRKCDEFHNNLERGEEWLRQQVKI